MVGSLVGAGHARHALGRQSAIAHLQILYLMESLRRGPRVPKAAQRTLRKRKEP